MAATDGAVGVALLQLGLLRFGAFGNPLDLFAGLAFGTLALANLGVRLLAPLGGELRFETALALLVLTQALAAILFLAGLGLSGNQVPREQRRALALGLVALLGLVLSAGSVGALAFAGNLGGALSPDARSLLTQRAPVYGFLAGQAAWLVLVDGVLALLFLVAAAGYTLAAWRLRDPHTEATAAALLLLCFAQLHAVLFPPVVTGYIASADVFRLAAYLAVLFNLVGRLGSEIADHAAKEERLRLSRELHDGLAQYLSLLNLRLSRATTPHRPADARGRDLEAAQRLLEAALLEARQAIAVLRTGRIDWLEFLRAVVSFADEFAANHDVDVKVTTEGELPPVDAELQLEVLRVVQESFSNSLRHGGATRLTIAMTATRTGLHMRIQDNGRGFDLEQTLLSRGVGLDSMIERLQRRRGTFRIDSEPGEGATVNVWLPVARPKRAAWSGVRPRRFWRSAGLIARL
jgi:signal transduction histidine kinase